MDSTRLSFFAIVEQPSTLTSGEQFDHSRMHGILWKLGFILNARNITDCLQKGILNRQSVVNVCFRQLVLKYSDYSGKLSFFG